MTLRSEIHTAIDDIAPPAPALPREAVAFALSNSRLRSRETVRSQPGGGLGMRRVGSLVAAALVVVMMITLVIGGRLWRDWNTQQQNAARQAHVAELRERQLYLPVVDPSAACPESTLNVDQGVYGGYGDGPVYASGTGNRYGLPSGTYFDSVYWVDPEGSGLILIRGRDLKTNQTVVFAKPPFPSVTATGSPSGKVTGTEVVLGVTVELHDELLLDPSLLLPPPADYWAVTQGFPTGSSGCIGIQADGFLANGSAFTEIIVVNYLLIS